MINERNRFIDVLKGVLIILVLIGHFGGDNTGNSDLLNSIEFFIYIFHMPVFVFISGYLSKNLEKNKERGFNNFIFFILFQIAWLIFSIVLNEKKYLTHIWEAGPALWYILALAVWRFFLKDILKIKHILGISFIIATLSICTVEFQPILGIPRIISFLPFFLLGYYTNDNIVEKIKKIPTAVSGTVLILIFLLSYFIVTETNIDIKLLAHNHTYKDVTIGSSNIIYAVFLNAASYVIAIISGINFISICKHFEKNDSLIKIGKNTLSIYILSNYIQKIVYIVQHKMLGKVVNLNVYQNYIVAIGFAMITIIICSSDFVVKKFNLILDKWKKIILR